MDVLLVASWTLVVVALGWAIVGIARFARFTRRERRREEREELLAQRQALLARHPLPPLPPLPRPQLPDRDRYRRARSRRVVPGEDRFDRAGADAAERDDAHAPRGR